MSTKTSVKMVFFSNRAFLFIESPVFHLPNPLLRWILTVMLVCKYKFLLLDILFCVVKKSKEKEWTERLQSLENQINYWINPDNKTNKTFYLPPNPLNGQMFYIKAIPVVGGVGANLTIDSNGIDIDGDPIHTQISLATSGSQPGGFVELIYHDDTNLWLVLANYRATFV